MKTLLVIATIVVMSCAGPAMKDQWSSFKQQHGKSYNSPSEEQYRLSIFMENLKMIEEHNAKYTAGLVSYHMKMNRFADLLLEEVSAQLNGFNKTGQLKSHELTGLTYLSPANVELPQSVDWRQKGAVTPVKDQGQCGSCWAFSTTGSMEGQLFRKTGKLVSLSEQQLVDCSSEFGNAGCNGGLMDNAFKYIKQAGGLASEESYPYEGENGYCRFRKIQAVRNTIARSFVDIPAGDEEALKSAVATVGPVSVAISAGNIGFMNYGGGVFSGETCNPSKLDHGVLVVGYGTEDGQDYWIVKNSWNAGWGEEGYVRLARNRGNVCGIASMASYPAL